MPCAISACAQVSQNCGRFDKTNDMCAHVPLQASSLAFLEFHLRSVLGNDSSAISTLRCLKLYLERLGCNHLDSDTMHSLAGSAFKLVRR